MPSFPRIPQALRSRRAQAPRPPGAVATPGRAWPSPTVIFRGPQLLMRGPRLLLRGPRLLLRAPGAILRTPSSVRARLFSSSRARRQKNVEGQPHEHAPEAGPSSEPSQGSFTSRLRKRLSSTPTKWYPIPVSLGVALLVVVNFYKQRSWEQQGGKGPVPESEIKVKGPWQVHVLGALPLRSMSRLYGMVNSYTLPVWFRVPGYKLYSFIFGVNLTECEPSDLREYRSMSEFFMRRLRPGVRPIAKAQLVSPADGKVVNFGSVEGGRVEQVKGSTYSLEALLNGTGQVDASTPPPPLAAHTPHPQQAEYTEVDEAEFANLNGIHYSLDELLGPEATDTARQPADASLPDKERSEKENVPQRTVAGDASVALEVAGAAKAFSAGHVPKDGNKLFFTVVYLAPGDYHRFHSPTSWVVERRRHFAGELFSVSPWMANKLQDLFVLNERVALLGRWRHGFFSMIPVGATNVGSIRVNFDSSLRTNSPLRPITPGTYSEATYAKASALLRGQPLQAGDEVGGFWLGSTIVLVFEAPVDFEFAIEMGQTVKVGEKLGDCRKDVSSALLIATSVTAPVVPDLAFLKVTLTNSSALRNSSVTFGALGHCVLDVAPAATDQDLCSSRSIGYSIGQIVANTTRVAYSTSNLDALTKTFVLHPVAAGMTFFAFLVAAVSHRLGFIFSALVASLAWLITLVVLIVDVVVIVAVKTHIEGDGSGATVAFGTAFWLVIAASLTLFFGYITTLFSCITDRRSSKH